MRLAFLVALLLSLTAWAQAPKTKVILDTDIGDDIDDAWALGFVVSYPGFKPLGITMAHGNTPGRAKIACKLLHIAGREAIPVLVGRQTSKQVAPQFSWAEDYEKTRPATTPAADFIVEMARRYPGEVVLIAVGPLENVADALQKEPNLGKLLKRVVLMSGCIYGTATKPEPAPEYNVYAALADSRAVYGAGLPLTIVPLDSTTRVQLRDEERARVQKSRAPLAYALECLYRLWLSRPAARMTLHDQLAVAEAARPAEFFELKETLPIVVDDKGFTRIDREHGKPVAVCLEPRREQIMEYYLSVLLGPSSGK